MGKIIPILVSAFMLISGGVVADPKRVVSINLCTDYLAYKIAAPGQLVSYSFLSVDKASSLIVEEAQAVGINTASAEEILQLKPDLVLAGSYSRRNTVHLLRRLGVKVVEFDTAHNLEKVRQNITKMGEVLGRKKIAGDLLATFNKELASVRAASQDVKTNPLLSTYSSNSYVAGPGTLISDMILTAGFRHLGSELEPTLGGRVSLEKMIIENPDYLIEWHHFYKDKTRATEIVRHPALNRWFGKERRIKMDPRYWSCGTPAVLQAIKQLSEFRLTLNGGGK